MDENMVMENNEEVMEPEMAAEVETEEEVCDCGTNNFGSGMIGGAIATGAILGGVWLINKIKAKRAAKKALKEASANAEESDSEEE